VQQSYDNCGLESSRALILAAGGSATENEVLNYAVTNNLADHSEANPAEWGGTGPDERQAVLSHFGVASHEEAATPENIAKAVADGKGVITSHDAGKLWLNQPDGSGHAITVTGTESDADGNITTVITNDTGLGEGERPVPAQQFFDSLRPGRPANISDGPLK